MITGQLSEIEPATDMANLDNSSSVFSSSLMEFGTLDTEITKRLMRILLQAVVALCGVGAAGECANAPVDKRNSESYVHRRRHPHLRLSEPQI